MTPILATVSNILSLFILFYSFLLNVAIVKDDEGDEDDDEERDNSKSDSSEREEL